MRTRPRALPNASVQSAKPHPLDSRPSLIAIIGLKRRGVSKEEMMRAVFYTEQGPAAAVLKTGEQPAPQPGPGEVRVKLRVSGVNPSDWKTRRGGFGRALAFPLIIPHSDGAGDIDAAGEGVTQSRIGERVWIWNGQWKRAFGTAAEYIALPSAQAVTLPASVDYAEGAGFGIPALTAIQAVRLAEAGPGMTVLVHGGAGAVGHYAIQFAKRRGARVLATISSGAKAKLAAEAGADATINYRAENAGDRIMALTGGVGLDAVIDMDLAANAKLLPAILRPFGKVVIYGTGAAEAPIPALWLMQNSATFRFFIIYEISAADRTACIDELDAALRDGGLVHNIGLRLPLEQAAAAHEALEAASVTGNVVLDIA
jgi:NADPH:quinone reductase